MRENTHDAAGFALRSFPTLHPFHAHPNAHDPQGVQRLAMSESPYGPSPLAVAAALAELSRLRLYPHSDGEPLRGALAEHFGVPPDCVLVGNGTDELILLAALVTSVPERHGVTTASTFYGYHASMESAFQRAIEVPLVANAIDVDAIGAAMEGAGCVMVCNPHNPCGSSLGATQVATLVERARTARAVLVLDEAYAEFTDPVPEVFGSGLSHIDGGSVVVLRTFSKAYGLAGLRAGYAIGDRSVIAAMRTVRNALPYNTNRVALAAATAALCDQEYLRTVVEGNREARQELAEMLRDRGFETPASQTNFVLTRLGPDAPRIVERLARDHNVHVRDATNLGFPGWVRWAVPLGAQLPALAVALDRARADLTVTDITTEDQS